MRSLSLSVAAAAAALLAVATPCASQDASIGVAGLGFAGVSIPIAQDDNGTGSQFGLRAPIALRHVLTLEAYFSSTALGEGKVTVGGTEYTRTGYDITGFGANFLLGRYPGAAGVQFYPYAGIGSNSFSRDGSEDFSDVGLNFGLGFGFTPMPRLFFDLRGEAQVVITGDTSRKFANITGGVGYAIR
jgi:hypothetical protein